VGDARPQVLEGVLGQAHRGGGLDRPGGCEHGGRHGRRGGGGAPGGVGDGLPPAAGVGAGPGGERLDQGGEGGGEQGGQEFADPFVLVVGRYGAAQAGPVGAGEADAAEVAVEHVRGPVGVEGDQEVLS